MRKSFMMAAAMALVAVPALAQTPASPAVPATPGNSPTVGGAPTVAPRAAKINPLTQADLSQVKGTDVYGADGKKLGSVDTVLMNPQSKEVDRLVVKAGGVLGVGGRDVAVPLDQFTWDGGKEGFRLSQTEDQLKSMPEWQATTYGSTR
jgi:sporulation protein YlmC with PRC-barrel domain